MLEIATRIMIGSIFHCYEPGAWRAKIESFAYRRDRVNEIFSGVSLRVSLLLQFSAERPRLAVSKKKKPRGKIRAERTFGARFDSFDS